MTFWILIDIYMTWFICTKNFALNRIETAALAHIEAVLFIFLSTAPHQVEILLPFRKHI